MKKILLLVVLLSALTGTAQEVKYTRDYYLTKSKNQRTMGWIMLAGGAGLAVAGIVVGNSDNNDDPNELGFGPNFDAGVWLLGGGIAIGAASIPFFVSSANNARKAASISFMKQKILVPKNAGLATRTQPAISLRISL